MSQRHAAMTRAAIDRLRAPDPRVAAILLLAVLLGGLLGGCAARPRRHRIMDQRVIKVDLVREVKGFRTLPKGYEHPAIISAERAKHVLGAIDIETRDGKAGGVIRQPAIHPDILQPAAEALSKAFAEVGPDEEVGLMAIRKEKRLGILHKKYLTTFLAYMQDGQLYLLLRRVDWEIPRSKEQDPQPRPSRGRQPMDFRVVSGDHIFYVGTQALEIDWQNRVFRQPYKLPGATGGGKQRREILAESPVTESERNQLDKGGVGLDDLTPDQLRALADLEDDRRSGRITEAAYQRARRQLLRNR